MFENNSLVEGCKRPLLGIYYCWTGKNLSHDTHTKTPDFGLHGLIQGRHRWVASYKKAMETGDLF